MQGAAHCGMCVITWGQPGLPSVLTVRRVICAADCAANAEIVFYVDLHKAGPFRQWPSIVYRVFINRILMICKYPAGNPAV